MWKKGHKQSPEHTEKIAASRRREKHHNWKGGQKKTGAGYWKILCPQHPHADASGRVLRHRLIMEAHLGRVLLPTEVVHHINGDKEDDRIENLMLYSSASEHTSFHRRGGLK